MMRYEQLLDLLKARRSVRRFTGRAVAREDLVRLLEAARWAPSNHNRQPWKFVVLEDRAQICALAEAVGRRLAVKAEFLPAIAAPYAEELRHHATFYAHAPVLLVVLHKRPARVSAALLEGEAEPSLVSGEPLSAAMAVQNLLLAAQALGLGACVLTGPLLARDALAGALALPAGHEVTGLVAVGYPAEAPEAPRRKSLEHIAEFRQNAGQRESGDDRRRNP